MLSDRDVASSIRSGGTSQMHRYSALPSPPLLFLSLTYAHAAEIGHLPSGCGDSASLYRWSIRSLGGAREDKHTVAITFRVVPRNIQNTQKLQTFGLPERVFYCFPEAELGNLLSAAELGKSTDPLVTGEQQIKAWIRICSMEHNQCPKYAGSASKFVPSRPLHIGGKRTGDPIRVINTSLNNVNGPYVTLSHCWGKAPLVTLRSSTLEEFMFAGVPWSRLSRSF